ncbi:MAG: hypothetical protein AAF560_02770 [Acidobacteriota bacterium]
MVAFASLFLGLFFGVKPVEVVVGDGVAAVELRLDGERLGMLRGAPWSMECDFGADLEPQHLEAIAFDAENRELGRVSQWLNLPKEPVVASVALEPRKPGEPRVVRLSWESSAGAEPKSVTATLDGVPLTFDDPRRITLPEVDESQLHLLQFELEFDKRTSSRVDFTFGGVYVDEVSTEITALAIQATRRIKRPPTVAAAGEWFLKDGEPLRVIAVEKETAEIVVVLDRPFPRFIGPGEPYKVPKSLGLSGDQRLRFLSTVPRQSEGVAATFSLFPVSPAYDGGLGDLYRLLTGISFRNEEDAVPRLNSAVAVGGLTAYRGRHRRAVVIIPRAKPVPDDSLTPAQARRYLEHLRVPLVVWNPESKRAPGLDAWGEVRDVGTLKELAAAFEALSEVLAEQWIVWLDGQHLPQEIELAAAARDFALLR